MVYPAQGNWDVARLNPDADAIHSSVVNKGDFRHDAKQGDDLVRNVLLQLFCVANTDGGAVVADANPQVSASQRIAPGVTYLFAPGHTKGNCIVAVETDGLFYLIHGDITYTDVALYENRLSVVFEDQAAARETLDRVRAFCRARPTVYLGTHTPEALESLGAKRVVDLANPPAVIPPGEIVFKTPTGKYICSVCGYVYDPAEHDGVAFEDLPADWRCPRCKQPKDKFNRA